MNARFQSNAVPALLPINKIRTGRNPRKYFEPGEMLELSDSIKAHGGLIQPIVVRPVEGDENADFEIVAGERRWRAAKDAFGVEGTILALVRELSDDEVDEIALVENVQRANMSPTEEAAAAAKILGTCNGDREEASKRLGWSRSTLDKRLGLMNCSELVQVALNERKISLGHAELLAAAPKAKQDEAIQKLLAAPSLPTVAQVRASLENAARVFDSVDFDKTDCAACQHNSSQQAALFSESVAGGRCTNAECFEAKTLEMLDGKAAALRDEYPVVRIVVAGENKTLTSLVAEGDLGVGAEQALACRSCAKFGAAVSNIPGKVGQVFKNLCFDPSCNQKKVAERIAAEKAVNTPAPGATKSEKAKAESTNGAPSEKKEKAAPVTEVHDSQRVKEYREKIWRKIYREVTFSDKANNPVMLVALALGGHLRHVSDSKLREVFGRLTGNTGLLNNLGEAARVVSANPTHMTTMIEGISASASESLEIQQVVNALGFLEVEIANHWKINDEYLQLLTKSEIDFVCGEIGLKAAKGKEFSKLMSGKKDEIIKAILAVNDFDFAGKVPTSMKWGK